MIKTLKPPKDEKQLIELAFEIIIASESLGIHLDKDNFINAWVNGIRVIADVDKEQDKITSIAFVAHGPRWFDPTPTATILTMAGDIEKLVAYIRDMCSILGVESLMYFVKADAKLPNEVKTQQQVIEEI